MAKGKLNLNIVVPEFLKQVKRGFCNGINDGTRTHRREGGEPPKMCVEAALCYALGEQTEDFDNDKPSCCDGDLNGFKIDLNDRNVWKSNKDRAKALKRLGILQLGTKGMFKGDRLNQMLRDHLKANYPEIAFEGLSDVQLEVVKALQQTNPKLASKFLDEVTPDEHVQDIGDLNTCSREDALQSIKIMEEVLMKAKTPGAKWIKKHAGTMGL